MRMIAALALLSLTLPVLAQAEATDPPSVHGMAMVGRTKGRVYLSHLPMFHNPHDYQGLFEAEIDATAHAAYLKGLNEGKEASMTLVPETFVLPDVVREKRPFRAKIVRGHFERGGVEVAANVNVRILRVLHFRKLTPTAPRTGVAAGLLFGNRDEQFLAHTIGGRPDFDQIVKVSAPAPLLARLQTTGLVEVIFPKLPPTQPFPVPGVHLFATKDNSRTELPLRLDAVLYQEFGDLTH